MSQLTFCKMDEGLRAPLQKRMKEILAETESHNAANFNDAYWEWQYRALPSGKSDIFLALLNDEIQGYYHVPYYDGRFKGKNFRFAMIQDVAVSETMRGKGIFRLLAAFANSELDKEAHLAYTFPNQKSIHNFLKYDRYALLKSMDAYILPLNTRKVIQSKRKLLGLEYFLGLLGDAFVRLKKIKIPKGLTIEKISVVNDEIVDLYKKFQDTYSIGLIRDRPWLNWRFIHKPGVKHEIIIAKEKGVITAAAIFKADSILNNKAIVLLDFAFLPGSEKHLLAIVQRVKQSPNQFFSQEVNLIFTAGCSAIFKRFSKIGFFNIPKRFNPRPLNLLVRDIQTGEKNAMMEVGNWHLTLGDWDVL